MAIKKKTPTKSPKKGSQRKIDNKKATEEVEVVEETVPKTQLATYEPPFKYNSFWCSIKQQCTCSIVCMMMCEGKPIDEKGRHATCNKIYPDLIKDPREIARLEMFLQKFPNYKEEYKKVLTRLGLDTKVRVAESKQVHQPVKRKGFKLEEAPKRKAVKLT